MSRDWTDIAEWLRGALYTYAKQRAHELADTQQLIDTLRNAMRFEQEAKEHDAGKHFGFK